MMIANDYRSTPCLRNHSSNYMSLLFSKDNTHKIVWAIGSTDGDSNGNIRKHYAKGSKSVLFFSLTGRSQTKPVPNTYVDVRNTDVRVLTFYNLKSKVEHMFIHISTYFWSSKTISQLIKYSVITRQLHISFFSFIVDHDTSH